MTIKKDMMKIIVKETNQDNHLELLHSIYYSVFINLLSLYILLPI